jgi:hypothetical protein
MTGEEIGQRLQLPPSTVAGHLAGLGLGRLSNLSRRGGIIAPAPATLHLDVKKLACFRRSGHRFTDDSDPRSPATAARARSQFAPRANPEPRYT